MFVKFWGVRGSIPTPGHRTHRYGGNTPCVEIRSGDTLLILDGGTGLRELGTDLHRRFRNEPLTLHLLFSHPHWDHIQGFPFFTPAYAPTTTLYVYGAAKGDRTIYDLLSGQMQSSYFPVTFSSLGGKVIARDLEPKGRTEVGGIGVSMLPLIHPGGCLGFAFEHDGHKVVYMTDNEIDQALPEKARAPGPALRPVPEAMVAFAQNADLLIADGQYTEDENAKRVGWGHPRASTVVDLAVKAKVKQLALTHHDPMHSDAEGDSLGVGGAKRAQNHGAKRVVFGAREGIELKIASAVGG